MKLNFKQFIYQVLEEEIYIPKSKFKSFFHWLVELNEPKCPKCGVPMILRKNGATGSNFYGCSKYPKCKGTLPKPGNNYNQPQSQPMQPQITPTNSIWTYAKVISKNFQVPFGKEIAVKINGNNWQFMVLDPTFQPNKGMISNSEVASVIQSFKKNNKSVQSFQPSMTDLNSQLEEYRKNWTPTKLGFAHQNNFENFKKAVDSGMTPVIVDNTNLVHRDFKNYIEYAAQSGYHVIFEEPESPWWLKYRPYLKAKSNIQQFAQENNMDHQQAKDHIDKHLNDFADILAQKNAHGVPLETIKNMINKWQEL